MCGGGGREGEERGVKGLRVEGRFVRKRGEEGSGERVEGGGWWWWGGVGWSGRGRGGGEKGGRGGER